MKARLIKRCTICYWVFCIAQRSHRRNQRTLSKGLWIRDPIRGHSREYMTFSIPIRSWPVGAMPRAIVSKQSTRKFIRPRCARRLNPPASLGTRSGDGLSRTDRTDGQVSKHELYAEIGCWDSYSPPRRGKDCSKAEAADRLQGDVVDEALQQGQRLAKACSDHDATGSSSFGIQSTSTFDHGNSIAFYLCIDPLESSIHYRMHETLSAIHGDLISVLDVPNKGLKSQAGT